MIAAILFIAFIFVSGFVVGKVTERRNHRAPPLFVTWMPSVDEMPAAWRRRGRN